MKALIRDYLGSLRERDELDAILPDLLSELGFTVISRPQRGTTQRGVDIAAIGPGEDATRKLYLFCVKPGDLTRQDRNGTDQAVRPSMDEIVDAYLPHRVPKAYQGLPVVICLAIGGVIKEQVQELWSGYTTSRSTDKVSYACWNGDQLADLLLQGILREELLPKPMRSSFQKAVAMVDTPDVSFAHFAHLTAQLHKSGQLSHKARVRAARQINICLWILYVWARDVENVEAPCRASEQALLTVWELIKPLIGKRSAEAKKMFQALSQIIQLHIHILKQYIDERIAPHAGVEHGLTMAVGSKEAIDINLALFNVLGRLSMLGIWISWLADRAEPKKPKLAASMRKDMHTYVEMAFKLISNNPALLLPASDSQATDIAMMMFLWMRNGGGVPSFFAWLAQMTERFDFTIRVRGRYPCATSDYQDLADHPRDRSDEYFQEMTSASTFVPLLAAWLHGTDMHDVYELLERVVREKLRHCTMQLWIPDTTSEEHLYLGNDTHGRALSDLSLHHGGAALIADIEACCRENNGFQQLTAIATGYWPVAIVACRHHGLPIPPQFWIAAFTSKQDLQVA